MEPRVGPTLRTVRYDKDRDKKYQELVVAGTIKADSDLHILSKLFQTEELALGLVATVSKSREILDAVLLSGICPLL